MNYISLEKKKIVGRNNQTIPRLVTDFDTSTSISFNFIDASNRIVDVPASAGLYFAGSMTMNPTSGQMLWLCNDFTIDGKTLTFNNVDTYTSGYFNNVTKKGTEVNIEIGVFNGHQKEVLLRDFGMANPRIYLNGLDPHDIDITDFYTKSEVDALIASIEIPIVGNGILTLTQNGETLGEFSANGEYNVTIDIPGGGGGGGGVTSAYVEEKIEEHDDSETAHNARFAEKQDTISNDSKLAYSLISGTPYIPTKTSDLTNDSDFQTASEVAAAVSGKADKMYVTTLAASSTSVQLQDGVYAHTPSAAPTYTLPAVTDALFHSIILTVGFSSTTSATFTYNGSTVTPLDALDITLGDVVEYLCRYDVVKATWIIACGKI